MIPKAFFPRLNIICAFLFFAVVLCPLLVPQDAYSSSKQLNMPNRWELRSGYGWQYKSSRRPNNYQITPVLPSAVVPLKEFVSSSFLRGVLEWNPELFCTVMSHPYTRVLLGVTPLQFQYSFQTEPEDRLSPYLVAGAGVLWANIERRETGSDLDFNLQVGIGVRYAFQQSTALLIEYRHVHISNAGIDEDNGGINAHTFLIGLSFKK